MSSTLKKKNYIPKTVSGEDIALLIKDQPNVIPDEYKSRKKWPKTKYVSVKYDSDIKDTPDITIEDTIIEIKHCKPAELETFRRYSTQDIEDDIYINIGIPTQTFNWIFNSVSSMCCAPKANCKYEHQNESLTWMTVSTLPEYTDDKELVCYIYDKKLKATTRIGTVKQVSEHYKSNLVGFGQFCIYIKPDHTMEYFITSFAMTNVTPLGIVPQPEIEVSPPDDILRNLPNFNQ